MVTPKEQREKPATDQDKQNRQELAAVIGSHVLNSLGQPRDLLRVEVRSLWKDRYRVNVLVGEDAVSVRIAHSFFLVVGGEGNILEATPEITRRY